MKGGDASALGGLMVSTCLVGAAYASAFIEGGASWGVWCMVLGVAGTAVCTMAMGTRRGRSRGRLVNVALAGTFICIVAGLALGILLPDRGSAEVLLLGLPLRAAAVIYLVGVGPLFVLPLVYAVTFESFTLDSNAIERIRAASAQRSRDA